MIQNAWSAGKRVAVPRCISGGIMELFEIRSWADLKTGKYNISEPKAHCTPIVPSEIDFAVISCLSCDQKRNRLGHGAGYYDRYLMNAAFPIAAVCREQLLLNSVCRELHDHPVDMVITERTIY